jgi:hypothetical protein
LLVMFGFSNKNSHVVCFAGSKTFHLSFKAFSKSQ